MSQASEQMRVEWAVNDAKRDAGQKTPENIFQYDDIKYGPDDIWNVLDVYRPKNKNGRMPVIVVVHGGGWVYGDKNLYQFYAMGLAERGFAVVNYSYRLAPENKFPAQLEDENRVVKWMSENCDLYGFDMNNVFMVGDSAGAHLLGLYMAVCTDRQYAAALHLEVISGFVPKAIALNCGAYRPMEWSQPHSKQDEGVTALLMNDLLPYGGTDEELKMIDVTEHLNADFPPIFIMTAFGDSTVGADQANLLTEASNRIGLKYIRKEYGDKEHPLYHVFHVTMQEPMADVCNNDECEFFKTLMK